MAVLIAAVATVAWLRLPGPATRLDPVATSGGFVSGTFAALITRKIGIRTAPFAVLALAILWVGLLSAGMPYPVFWWIALLASCGAWMWNLASRPHVTSDDDAGKHAAWIVLPVALGAVCVILFASRPDADDAFYRSISATLLRFPQQPVLLHDTLYRLPDVPILLQFYRLSSYEIGRA
ncbi:MAG: hypothetical protein EPN40_00340, partial [Rhodanobacteraceae bacterium]